MSNLAAVKNPGGIFFRVFDEKQKVVYFKIIVMSYIYVVINGHEITWS